jgi:hypothetical protein
MIEPQLLQEGTIIQWEGEENYLIFKNDNYKGSLSLLSLNNNPSILDVTYLTYRSFRANRWAILKS